MENTSAIVKPCFCVGVLGGSTVHLFRVLSEVLYCSVFSLFRIGNSFRYKRRHVTSSRRKPFIVILNLFSYLIKCSFRSSGRLLIAHAIVSLVPLLHFHGTWICSCVARRLRGLLWLHGLLIEHQVDGVTRMRRLHNGNLLGVTSCPTSRPNVVLIPPWSQSSKKGAQR